MFIFPLLVHFHEICKELEVSRWADVKIPQPKSSLNFAWRDPVFEDLRKAENSVFRSFTKFITCQLQNFRMYQKYRVIIEFLFLQNTCFDSNFNRIYDYDYGTQNFSIFNQLFNSIILRSLMILLNEIKLQVDSKNAHKIFSVF